MLPVSLDGLDLLPDRGVVGQVLAGLMLVNVRELVAALLSSDPPLHPVLPLIVVGESVLCQERVQLCSILKLP